MAKKRKTRSEKKRADLRQISTPNTTQTSSQAGAKTISQRQHFTYTPSTSATSQAVQPMLYGHEYLSRDLRKTILVTGAIILVQLVLAFGMHVI